MNYNFTPDAGGTQVLAATASSQVVTVRSGCALRIYNAAAVTAFVRLCKTTATASVTTDMPIKTLDSVYIDTGANDAVAIILASSTGNVYVTTGQGRSGS